MSIRDAIPINWGLIANPLNWIIVASMVLIAGIAVHLAVALLSDQTKGA